MDKYEKQEIENKFINNKNISIDAPLDIDWFDENQIYQMIQTFDIGVSPLIDNEFNRCKSAFKLKQCLSCGVPVLGSKVGENRSFLIDNFNGFFCENPKEYENAIRLIKKSSKLFYQTLSNHSTQTLPTFCLDNYCSTFINYFKQETNLS